jgi:anti-sigma factor RsiW
MNCRDAQGLAGNYLDGELPEELCDRLQRHLLRCGACREEFESLRMAAEVLAAATKAPAVREEFVTAALEALRRELDISPAAAEQPGQLVLGIGAGTLPAERK